MVKYNFKFLSRHKKNKNKTKTIFLFVVIATFKVPISHAHLLVTEIVYLRLNLKRAKKMLFEHYIAS